MPGRSAEQCLKTVKYGSARYYDTLPTSGNEHGRAFRDVEMEGRIHKLTQTMGIGAQFGGKYFCHDVRVIRLPRHGASCPVGIGVSCSADRQALGRIDADGVWLEELETDPAKYLPEVDDSTLGGEVVSVDLNQPMASVRQQLSAYPIKTRLSLSGTIVVARDIAHAKLQARARGRARARTPTPCPARAHVHRPVLHPLMRMAPSAHGPAAPRRRSGSTPARGCRSTSRTTASTTRGPPRRPRATRAAPSARRRRGGWTRTSTPSRRRAARW